MNKYVILVAVIALVSQAQAGKQQLRLLNDQDNFSLTFTGAEANLSDFGPILQKFNRVCATGIWYFYTEENYGGGNAHFGPSRKDQEYCEGFGASQYKSVRYLGPEDTTTDALTLFSEAYFKNEFLTVTLRAKTDISIPVNSIILTGSSDWMIFDGPGLNGNSYCVTLENKFTWYVYIPNPLYIEIDNVRSVFRGCDLEEIAAYRKMNSL